MPNHNSFIVFVLSSHLCSIMVIIGTGNVHYLVMHTVKLFQNKKQFFEYVFVFSVSLYVCVRCGMACKMCVPVCVYPCVCVNNAEHLKRRDTRDAPKISGQNFIYFSSQRTFLQQLCTLLHCEITCSAPRPRLTSTALVNAHHAPSSLLSRAPFSCFFTSRKKSHQEHQLLLLLCTQALP